MTETQAKEVFRASMSQPPIERIDVDAAIRGGRRRRMLRRSVSIGTTAAVAILVTSVAATVTGWPRGLAGPFTLGQAGVTSQDDRRHPSASDPIFAGLPSAVVAEVLRNPAAQANIDMPISAEDRNSLWQGMVENFVMCRQLLHVYTSWRATGMPSTADFAIPKPTHPLQPSYGDLTRLYPFYASHMKPGHIQDLAHDLTNDSGCGKWVPATPGDITGPTIADVVRQNEDPAG